MENILLLLIFIAALLSVFVAGGMIICAYCLVTGKEFEF